MMFQYTKLLLRAALSLVFVSVAFFVSAGSASAFTYEVTGWGWSADDNANQGFCPCPNSGGIGWISFSNKTDQSAIPYGVNIDGATGDFSGYAWSVNTGWITFNALEMQTCRTNPGDSCPPGPRPKAHVDIVSDPNTGAITGGTGNVTGWARSCAVFVSGCSGAVRASSQTGTWDGWISLSGATYGLKLDAAAMKFLGPTSIPACSTCYAWDGGLLGTGFGWGINLTNLNVSIVGAGPLLSFWADQTTLVSGQSTALHWITSADVTSCTATGSWGGSKLAATTIRSQSTGILVASQTYNLQCFDSSGGSTPLQTVDIAVSSAPVSVNGACGAASGVPSRSAPVANLCSSGSPSVVTKDTSVTPNLWRWSCSGFNGGTSATCSAETKKAFHIIEI